MNTVEEFKQLISQHDITYDFSDDDRVYQRGRRQKQKILELAKQIPEAKDLWNAEIDKRLSLNMRQPYYWK